MPVQMLTGLPTFDFFIGNHLHTAPGMRADMAICDCGVSVANFKWLISTCEVLYGIVILC
jgi:hypothetical protein